MEGSRTRTRTRGGTDGTHTETGQERRKEERGRFVTSGFCFEFCVLRSAFSNLDLHHTQTFRISFYILTFFPCGLNPSDGTERQVIRMHVRSGLSRCGSLPLAKNNNCLNLYTIYDSDIYKNCNI